MAPQQILRLEVADSADSDSRQQVVDSGQHLDVKIRVERRVVDATERLGGGTRDGDDDRARVGACGHSAELLGRPEHPHAPVPKVLLAQVVVDEADRSPLVVRIALHRLHELAPGFTGPDDDGGN